MKYPIILALLAATLCGCNKNSNELPPYTAATDKVTVYDNIDFLYSSNTIKVKVRERISFANPTVTVDSLVFVNISSSTIPGGEACMEMCRKSIQNFDSCYNIPVPLPRILAGDSFKMVVYFQPGFNMANSTLSGGIAWLGSPTIQPRGCHEGDALVIVGNNATGGREHGYILFDGTCRLRVLHRDETGTKVYSNVEGQLNIDDDKHGRFAGLVTKNNAFQALLELDTIHVGTSIQVGDILTQNKTFRLKWKPQASDTSAIKFTIQQ